MMMRRMPSFSASVPRCEEEGYVEADGDAEGCAARNDFQWPLESEKVIQITLMRFVLV